MKEKKTRQQIEGKDLKGRTERGPNLNCCRDTKRTWNWGLFPKVAEKAFSGKKKLHKKVSRPNPKRIRKDQRHKLWKINHFIANQPGVLKNTKVEEKFWATKQRTKKSTQKNDKGRRLILTSRKKRDIV